MGSATDSRASQGRGESVLCARDSRWAILQMVLSFPKPEYAKYALLSADRIHQNCL